MEKNKKKKIDHDGHWKRIVSRFLKEFILIANLELYHDIDFSKGVEFLEQEFQELIATEGQDGKSYKDKLVKVYLKNGKAFYILIHIEIQSSHDPEFPDRMFKYYYLIKNYYGTDLTAVAFFTHYDVPDGHNRYYNECYGTRLLYEYNTIKVKNFPKEELMASTNPFALAILAVQYLNETKKDKDKRLFFKKKLVDLLTEKGYSAKESAYLLIFIKFMLKLPIKKEIIYEKHVKKSITMEATDYMKEYTEQLVFDTFGERFSDVLEARKEEEALRKEEEARHKETEARRKEEEALRKEAEERNKETETHLILSVRKIHERGDSIEEIMNVFPFLSREKIMAAINRDKSSDQ